MMHFVISFWVSSCLFVVQGQTKQINTTKPDTTPPLNASAHFECQFPSLTAPASMRRTSGVRIGRLSDPTEARQVSAGLSVVYGFSSVLNFPEEVPTRHWVHIPSTWIQHNSTRSILEQMVWTSQKLWHVNLWKVSAGLLRSILPKMWTSPNVLALAVTSFPHFRPGFADWSFQMAETDFEATFVRFKQALFARFSTGIVRPSTATEWILAQLSSFRALTQCQDDLVYALLLLPYKICGNFEINI